MSRHIAEINEVYVQALPERGIYRIYIRVYLETIKKMVLTKPETASKERLIKKYGLLETAFKNLFSGIESKRCIVRLYDDAYSFEEYL
jgi:hypothetical protein